MHSQSLPSLDNPKPESKVDAMPSTFSLTNEVAQDKSCFGSKDNSKEKTANTFYHRQSYQSLEDLIVQKKQEKPLSCSNRTVTVSFTKQFDMPVNSFHHPLKGVPVNGFHPQWSASPNLCLPSPLLAGEKVPSSVSANQRKLNEKIFKMIGDFKRQEKEKSKKRVVKLSTSRGDREKRKRVANDNATLIKDGHDQSLPFPMRDDDSRKRGKTESSSCISSPNQFSNLYGDVFLDSDVPQLIATSGGRIIAWNDTFLGITGLSSTQISSSMSVFSLIVPRMIPKLFDLFGLALRAGSPHPSIFRNAAGDKENVLGSANSALDQPVEEGSTNSAADQGIYSDERDGTAEGNADEMYTSMSLPCVRLAMADTSYHITLTLMDDMNPNKCCFYCVLSRANKATDSKDAKETPNQPRNTISCSERRNPDSQVLGEIMHISSKALANLLCPQ